MCIFLLVSNTKNIQSQEDQYIVEIYGVNIWVFGCSLLQATSERYNVGIEELVNQTSARDCNEIMPYFKQLCYDTNFYYQYCSNKQMSEIDYYLQKHGLTNLENIPQLPSVIENIIDKYNVSSNRVR